MFFKKNYDEINVTQLNGMLGSGIKLIDVREVSEYNMFHIKGAENVPMGTVMTSPERFLEKGEKYYMVCQSGARSARVCDMLSKQGYDVTNIVGGTGTFAYKHSENIA
jgi:rhodanese-related sulfurtransferase